MPCKGTGVTPGGYSLLSGLVTRHCADLAEGVLTRFITDPIKEIPEVMLEFVHNKDYVYLVLSCDPTCCDEFASILFTYWFKCVSYVVEGRKEREPPTETLFPEPRLWAQELNGAVGFFRYARRRHDDLEYVKKDFMAFAKYLGAGVTTPGYVGTFRPSEVSENPIEHSIYEGFDIVVGPHAEIGCEEK